MKVSMDELRDLLAPAGIYTTSHPLANDGKRVLAILPHGFIYYGELREVNGRLFLHDAYNLRYWDKREGGLPEFAHKGPVEGDKIDKCHGLVFLESVIAILALGDWNG